jgi:hypothetical protein
VRYGIVIIAAIVVALLGGAYFIPYPETVSGRIIASDVKSATIFIPYKYVNTIKAGMKVNMEFEGYDAGTYGYQDGVVNKISKVPVESDGGNDFAVYTDIRTKKYQIVKGMAGVATIFITEKSVLQRMMPSLHTP